MLDEAIRFDNIYTVADVAELADAQASGACGLLARGGSSPLIRIKPAPWGCKPAFLAPYPARRQLFNEKCANRPINNLVVSIVFSVCTRVCGSGGKAGHYA